MTFEPAQLPAGPGAGAPAGPLAAVTHRCALGDLTLLAGERGLAGCSFLPAAAAARRLGTSTDPAPPGGPAAALLERARGEIDRYLDGALRQFTVPVDLGGVAGFDRAILLALRTVGYGDTTTYGELARRADLPASAARAVGRAMAGNPVLVVVPCHRVVGAGGSLVGYAGGLDVKRRLLDLETAGAGRALTLF